MDKKLKNLIEEGIEKSPAELKESLPGMIEEIRNAKIGLKDVMEVINMLGDRNGALGKIGGVDKLNALGKEVKDVIPAIIPTINEIAQGVINRNGNLSDAFGKIKRAKVTIGIYLSDIGIPIMAKFNGGSFSIENGSKGADLGIMLPTATILKLPQVLSGGARAISKLLITGGVKTQGNIMKVIPLLPVFIAIGRSMR